MEESLAGGVDVDVDVDEMLQYIEQTILLIGQVFNSVPYSRRMNVLTGVETKKAKVKTNSSRGIQRTFSQVILQAYNNYS